jgi:hypothetical protein
MKVCEALRIIQAAPNDAVLSGNFISRFSPISVQIFLNSHHQVALSDRKGIVSTGLHDNLSGTVERAAERPAQCVAVIIEWLNLDPRLGPSGSAPAMALYRISS